MSTRFSAALQMSNSTDALWRAWVQFIDDTLVVTGGWVNTADTGQMTISTSTHPTTINTKVGYRVYKMADALQATAPVFMRVDYGSDGTATFPSVWFTIGTGSDGAGTITTPTVTNLQVGPNTTATSVCNSYGSADTNRVQFMMFVRAGANDLMAFSLERTKDATGADTGDGLLLTSGHPVAAGGALTFTQYLIRAGGAQPPQEAGLSYVISNQSGSSVFGGDNGVGLPIHFKGIAQQPGVGMIIANGGDYLAEAQPSFSFYGATRTYQLCNSVTSQVFGPTGNGVSAARANTRCGIRFD